MMALDLGLRASVVVFVALAASAVLHRRSAALRYWILAAGILSAAAIAPLATALPAWDLPAAPPEILVREALLSAANRPPAQDQAAATDTRPLPAMTPAVDVEPLINLVWALGVAINVLVMLIGLRRLSQLTASAHVFTDERWLAAARTLVAGLNLRVEVLLRQTASPTMLGTWGWRRPLVLLPAGCESWSDERIHVVLGHELAHIRRGDWVLQMATDMVRAVFWYNPLFWLACARLRRESEAACDNAVLEAGVPAPDYADHLLQIARTCRPSPLATLVPMARRSTLEWRIAAMLNHSLIRTRPTRRALATIFAVIVGITLTTASFRAKEQASPMPFTGTAYDVTGAVLPGVVVTLEGAAGGRATATTDRTGRFDFGVVAPGRYKLAMNNLPGFQSATHEITLERPSQWDVNLTFQVGTLQERITVTEQRPAGAARADREPVRIGGNIKPPRKLVDVRPIYPASMRDAGIDGVVSLNALIDTEGKVSSVRVVGSQAHPELIKAASDAVLQWQFSPTLLNGDKIEVQMTVTVAFNLQD